MLIRYSAGIQMAPAACPCGSQCPVGLVLIILQWWVSILDNSILEFRILTLVIQPHFCKPLSYAR